MAIADTEHFAEVPFDLSHRDEQIASILEDAFEHDREARRAREYIASHRATPQLEDVVWGLAGIYASIAAVLHGPIARLVDRNLDVWDGWQWYETQETGMTIGWSPERQDRALRELFAEGGIEDHFNP